MPGNIAARFLLLLLFSKNTLLNCETLDKVITFTTVLFPIPITPSIVTQPSFWSNTGRVVLKKPVFSALSSKLNTGFINKD